MIHFSGHVKLVELETLQVIVGSYRQNAYLEEMMKPEFYANASLSSTVLCRKHYILLKIIEGPMLSIITLMHFV